MKSHEDNESAGFRRKKEIDRMSVHFSSESGEWATPRWLFEALQREFDFDRDVASNDENFLCPTHYTIKENGLLQDWGKGCAWMNPPYGRQIGLWMQKAYESAQAGATVVCLIPARPDTKWFGDYAMKGEIRFIRGRLKFGNAKNSAPSNCAKSFVTGQGGEG